MQAATVAVALYLYRLADKGPSLQTVVLCLTGGASVAVFGMLLRREPWSRSIRTVTNGHVDPPSRPPSAAPAHSLPVSTVSLPTKPVLLKAVVSRLPFPWNVIREEIATQKLRSELLMLSWPGWIVFTLVSNESKVLSGVELRVKGGKVIATATNNHPTFNYVTALQAVDVADWDDVTIAFGDMAPGSGRSRAVLVDLQGGAGGGPRGFLWWIQSRDGEVDSGDFRSIS